MTAPTPIDPPMSLARTTRATTPSQSPRLETNCARKNRKKLPFRSRER
jgi:hypothetical protein